MNIGEIFSSVLLSRVTDMMGNLEGLAKPLYCCILAFSGFILRLTFVLDMFT
jgi:hypothetical protein